MDKQLEDKLNQENRKKLIKRFNSMLKIGKMRRDYISNAYEDISYSNDSDDKSNKEIITELFHAKPLVVINQLIPHIVSKEKEQKASLNLDTEDFREKVVFPFTISFTASEFNIITDVGLPSLDFIDSDGNDVNQFINHEVELDRFNYLSKDIHLKGKFVQDESVSHNAFDYLDKFVSVYVTGVLADELIPSWVEYLIEGCINIQYKNNKMALFNIFASLDNFIEVLNEEIFNYYLENYNKVIKGFSITSEDKADISEFLKKKIKVFGKDNRKIIEKLRDALREVGINGKNNDFKSMYALIKKVDDISDIRNKIGHGKKVVDHFDVGDVLYTVLTVIFSTISHVDFEKNDWGKIIV